MMMMFILVFFCERLREGTVHSPCGGHPTRNASMAGERLAADLIFAVIVVSILPWRIAGLVLILSFFKRLAEGSRGNEEATSQVS